MAMWELIKGRSWSGPAEARRTETRARAKWTGRRISRWPSGEIWMRSGWRATNSESIPTGVPT